MLNEEFAKSAIGRQILEDEIQGKRPKTPEEPVKPPSPKFKTIFKLRETIPAPQSYSKRNNAYRGIGNDTFHLFTKVVKQVPVE